MGSETSQTVCRLSLLLLGLLSLALFSLLLLGNSPTRARRSAKLILDGLEVLELVRRLRVRKLAVVSASGGTRQQMTALVCTWNFRLVATSVRGLSAIPIHPIHRMLTYLMMPWCEIIV